MRRKARRGGARQAEVEVTAIGAQGDGIAALDGQPIFLPLTLPGDRVLARVTGEKAGAYRGEVIELRQAGAGRVEPPCPYFGRCGGCALQHLEADAYRAWKADLLRRAFERRGLAGEGVIRPLMEIGPGRRRRASLAAARVGGHIVLGFRQRRGHRVVDIKGCLLLTQALAGLIAPLRNVLGAVLGEGGQAEATLCNTATGLDLLITMAGELPMPARARLADFAVGCDLARLSWAPPGGPPEPVVQRRVPMMDFSGVAVPLPPGGFVQPSAEGEAFLVERLMDWLPDGFNRAVDLFAGCGTFSFALARRGRVFAVEGEAPALAALEAGARSAGLADRVGAVCRDLIRQPLLPAELEGAQVVVFDPPRAGAREQAVEIAASSVPTVIAVSCNPTTLARDARLLCEGGYDLIEACPLDQFPWSGHLEVIALFRR